MAIILGALCYRVFILLVGLLALTRSLKKRQRGKLGDVLSHKYVFLFPVYKEQKIILDTLKYYEAFLSRSVDVDLLFVSTIKEQGDVTTDDIITDFIAKSGHKDRIDIIQSSYREGTKATQLNVGLKYLQAKSGTLPYLVCLDCDARVQWHDFVRVDQMLAPDTYIYSFLPQPDLGDGWVKALMLHHAERMLVWEYAPTIFKHGFWHYPMGATIVVSPDLWRKISQFPEPIDDIPLQYLLHWQKLKFASVPYFTEVQAPPNLNNALRQMIPVFSGVFSYFSLAKGLNHTLTSRELIIGGGLYLFYCLEFIAIALSPYILITAPCLYGILYVLPAAVHLIWLKKLSPANILLHLIGYYLRLWQFIYFLFYGVIFRGSLASFKTDRK